MQVLAYNTIAQQVAPLFAHISPNHRYIETFNNGRGVVVLPVLASARKGEAANDAKA